jgi:hypothetical protein
MKRTVSEKIALVFEIAGYLWLVPSLISLFYPLLLLLGSIFTLSALGIFISAIPFLIFGLGVFFLMQYYRHSRGLLGAKAIFALWVGTLAFNLLLLLPSVYVLHASQESGHYKNAEPDIFTLVWGVLILWWSAAVLLSVTAIIGELKAQKYL